MRALAAAVAMAAGAVAAASASAADSRCAQLKGRHGSIEVVAATAIEAGSGWTPPSSQMARAPAPVRAGFCRVEGAIAGRIGFELWMPQAANWNGRLLGAGVGGDAGFYNLRDLARGVEAGYASATTDGGHKTTETLWMMRREAVLDYTHRAQHELNQAARTLIAKYYERPARYAYFLGCSGGGRQALKEMQRFPGDYDGVVAGAAAPSMPVMSARHLWQALYQQRNPAGALTADDWTLVAQSAVKVCDADDGLVDQVVENPRSCGFDVATLQCAAGQSQACLTAEKVRTVQAFQSPLRDEKGSVLDGGLLPGVTTRPGPPSPLLLPLFAQGAHRDPQWGAEQFNIVRDLKLVNRRMPQMRADDADLGAFARRGGKAILYQGWLDPSVIAGQSLDYFDKVQRTMGKTRSDSLLKLYMVPGMLHCGGGAGVDQFGGATSPLPIGTADRDLLTALTRWVEDGIAPGPITATRIENGKVARERPLCPWPQVAAYVAGDTASAASFRCEATAP